MNLKEYFENLDLEQVEEFVTNKREEDLHLDFKTANFPNIDTNYDMKNFSECLSGFSNSDGGLIIWGIKASKNSKGQDVAHDKKPIKELTKFSNHLKRNEGRATTPNIIGIDYKKFEINKNDEGYLVVFVPPSDRSPHMANLSEKHYYKRSGDSFYICEHFDIIDLIGRNKNPELKFELTPFTIEPVGGREKPYYNIKVNFAISNNTSIIAKYPKLEIIVNHPFQIWEFGLDGNRNSGLKRQFFKTFSSHYIGGADFVIYPENILEIDCLILPNFCDESNIEQLSIQYKLVCEDMKMITDTLIIEKEKIADFFKANKK